MVATVNGLTLEALLELLGNFDALADVRGPDIDEVFPNHIFPLRFDLRTLLWQRFGELAPDLALAKAFPDGEITREPGVQIEDILYGVAKDDAGKAFEAWLPHYADVKVEESFLTRQPLDSFADFFFMQWSETNSDLSVAAIDRLSGPLQEIAYRGYLRGLDRGANWIRETERFFDLFPDPGARRFESQGPATALAGQWAIEDPDAAFAWINTLEKSRTSDYLGYMEVVSTWMREEPTDASAWLREWSPPSNVDRDSFYRHILEGYGGESVAVSLAALELIPSQSVRDQAVRKIIADPMQDRDVLRMWEKSQLISPQVRAEVAHAIQERDTAGTGWIE